MKAPNQHAERVLLMLDLAAENQFDPEQILELRPGSPSTKVFSATDFGGVRTGRGWSRDYTRNHSAAVEAMVSAARPYIGRHTELLVSGMASLGSYAELGLRVSSWHDDVTLVNQRKDRQWDFCSIGGVQDREPYFDQIHFPRRSAKESGRVAVVVSSGYAVEPELIEKFFEQQGETLLSTVTLRAVPPAGSTRKDVTVHNTPGLARSLCAEIEKVKLMYPGQRGLAVFVVGPAQLAFLVGRAINPNVYTSVWFPHKHGDGYVAGSKVPWEDKVRVRMLLSAPEDLSPMDLEQEQMLAVEVLDRPLSRDSFDLAVEHAATFNQFFEMLMYERPQIVHFSGHGNENLLAFTKEDGSKADLVPAEAMRRALGSAKDPVNPPRLVVLNACLTEKQAEAMTEHVEFAIGMRPKIKDARAIAFTRRFYDALASGRSLQNAFDQARDYLSKWGAKADDTPKLFCRPGCDPNRVRFFEAK
ncbi:CHAT domain-containing protein [Paraliomyxa miuraensis]|uniref:CHAT domain-containing protein n=1 Tax=Paraliomyxa miuraensis TaxID=376150 RepID=UPI0022568389|nr:CHAT domain-containing protein [Paraliomyxa miuraensis]MCX4242511.1 CHAT domain-containing protein [Paraliomyxa miuraensis]